MKEVPVKLGPLALLLTVISICLTIMAILNFSTAKADVRLAEKYADTVKERYRLEQEGQAYLAGTARDLAQGMELIPGPDGLVWETIEGDQVRLSIALRPDGTGGYGVDTWQIDRQWEEDTSMGNLWNGF